MEDGKEHHLGGVGKFNDQMEVIAILSNVPLVGVISPDGVEDEWQESLE